MKCPKCSYNQRRGREGMTCSSCSYQFLFDPKRDSLSATQRLHDSFFLKIIKVAGAGGTYRFTLNQLFSSARGAVKKGLWLFVFILVIVMIMAIGMFNAEFWPGVIFCILIGAVMLIAFVCSASRLGGVDRKKWDSYVELWMGSGREIPGLIDSPALVNPPGQWKESDIYDYGVSGILLCNRRELVDWLVLNHFHSHNNVLIMTPDGYPTYLVKFAKTLLEETPDLPVWLLHDPYVQRAYMMKSCVFPVRNVTDLGITPDTISKMSVIRRRFGSSKSASLPLDAIPYKTLSAAVGQCVASGAVLGTVLATQMMESDTEISFG